MAVLSLTFMGSPRVEIDGAAVEVNLRKVLALLAYLAVTGQRHSRDALTEMLFPGMDRENARADLRRSLSILRGAIGTERVGCDRSSAWFEPGDETSVDVREFRSRLAGSVDPSGIEMLEEAVKLYRGDFLSGFYLRNCPAFEEWQLTEAESLRHEQATALQRLLEIHEGGGRIGQAIACARRLLALDRLEESSHRNLMRLYALDGRRSEAMRQYAQCRKELRRELGQEPDEETEALNDAIMARRLRIERPAKALRGDASRRAKTSPPRRRAPVTDIIVLATQPDSSAAGAYPTVDAAISAALALRGSSATRECRAAMHACARQGGAGGVEDDTPDPAAVLLRAAHPGQVLLTPAAAARVREERPKDAGVRSLGTHRLMDLGPARGVFQLVHPALGQDFPPLRTLDSMPNNLPVQPTPFLRRKREMATVCGMLGRGDVTLLTLTGPGGTGKTRLALQAAADMLDSFDDGVYFVDLVPLREPSQVVPAIAAALHVSALADGEHSLRDAVIHHLRGRHMLLVLDNFEHLLTAAQDIAELLAACPLLKVMTTSREALRLRAERECAIPPLGLAQQGETAAAVAGCEAARFFAERAGAVRPGFAVTQENAADVLGICVRLDGLPLAIELAAARMKSLTPADMCTIIDERLALRIEGPHDLPERQRTLWREIDWSYDLLDDRDKRLFRRLSVFAGGCTLDAARSVCLFESGDARSDAAEGLVSLVSKSLLERRDDGRETRFHMLQTIKEYAGEKLEQSGEADAVRARFADHHVEAAERMEPELFGPEEAAYLETIDAEYPNYRSALTWLLERGDRLQGIRLAGALGEYWLRRMQNTEAELWLRRFNSRCADSDPPGLRARLAFYRGWMLLWYTDPYFNRNTEATACFRESFRLWKEAGDSRGMSISLVRISRDYNLSAEERRACQEEAIRLAREVGDAWTLATCLTNAYSVETDLMEDPKALKAGMEEAIAMARGSGNPICIAEALHGMGDVCLWEGDLDAAEAWFLQGIQIGREGNLDWVVQQGLVHMPRIHLAHDDLDKARSACFQVLRLVFAWRARNWYPGIMEDAAEISRREGRMRRAARLRFAAALMGDPAARLTPAIAAGLGLDEQVTAAEWAAAKSLTADQAAEYALSNQD